MRTPTTLPVVDEEGSQQERENTQEEKPGLDEDDDAEVTPNEGADDTISIMAHVRDKIIPVHCGFGTQQVVWLGHVAIARIRRGRPDARIETTSTSPPH
ncbi:uncharacterized protein KRP23_4758 [Phytophthora ramorum]|uniref:uncharacterized protein n=1 Tax=Phytophthora ramorum TaxID=164328 RepID=UPI00309A4065|nr:hypothetical protein KRP23_4758 [Phytophthora ramorum]